MTSCWRNVRLFWAVALFILYGWMVKSIFKIIIVKMQFCDSQTKPVISYFYILSGGSLPSLSDGIVNRKACKVGFESCCTRSYDIQIKHCGSFYAYCLAALDTCPERYCFGNNYCIVLIMIRKSTLKPTFVKLNF